MIAKKGRQSLARIAVILSLLAIFTLVAKQASGQSSATLTTNVSTTTLGGNVNVAWSRQYNPSLTDWIGLYRIGAADTSYLDWKYTSSCTQFVGTTAKTAGVCKFVMPDSTGTYEFRLLADDGYIRLITSNAVSISNGLTWTLLPLFPMTTCISYEDGNVSAPAAWFLIRLSGTWTHPINFGIRDVPPGATVERKTFASDNPIPYQPISASGESSGGALGRVEVTVHLGSTRPNTYTATVWASDGVTEQTLPAALNVQMARCSTRAIP